MGGVQGQRRVGARRQRDGQSDEWERRSQQADKRTVGQQERKREL